MCYFFYTHNINHINNNMISCEHISANCNPMPNTLKFLNSNTIVFCFRDQVGLYKLDINKIACNLNFRQAEINRANCLTCPDESTIIVGYDSGHLIVYRKTELNEWIIIQVVKQQAAISMVYEAGDTIITNNVNALVTFYRYSQKLQVEGETTILTLIDTIQFPLNKILESIVQIDHGKDKIIFMAGTDQKIYCYTRNQSGLVYRFELSGHQNSITKLQITKDRQDYLLASSSKDGYIRLWRITQNSQVIKFHKNVRNVDGLYCFLDAVLISHETSVTSLKWVKFTGELQLVSCSLDCTICVWGVEKQGSAWTVEARMGQFLGNKNAYFNVECDPQFQYLVAVNYIGSAMIWNYNSGTKKYTLRASFNGHSNQVNDIDWDHTGNFLVSVSKDQTTRIISRNLADELYHQISRAQVHGYDINAVALVEVGEKIIDLIACGADQKVVRIIEPPACFANYLNYFTKANLHLFFPSPEEEKKYTITNPQTQILQYETYAEGGTQVLGLMTKLQRVQRQKISSYYDDEEEDAEEQQQKIQDKGEAKINFTVPPHDDYLIKHTLWPEMNKLYGHPHQISALAKNNKRKLLASSCAGKSKLYCSIIIWSTEDWKIKKMIEHHHYTVYAMDFSPCGKYFASVSKDRKLGVFNQNFELIFTTEAHARAIMCVSFSPNSDLVVTGSRDKFIKIHSIGTQAKVCQLELKRQVSSVVFCGAETIAAGYHDGTVAVFSFKDNKLTEMEKVKDKYSHTKAVKKLRWNNGYLASCSDDHSVRVFKLTLN